MILSPPDCAHVSGSAERKELMTMQAHEIEYTYSNSTLSLLENWVKPDFLL